MEIELNGHSRQAVTALLPLAEIEFIGQSLHAAEPELVLYFPARHNTQFCLSSPVAPALQVHCIRADPGGEWEFTGQTSQVELPATDHKPAEHS